jgi:hypothetical protein
MSKRTIMKTPREHFMRAVEDELAKFERREIAFQRADRDERAAKLRLPVSRDQLRQRLRVSPHD